MTSTTWHWPVRCAIATSPITFWVSMIKDQMAADYSIREQIDGKNILSLTLKHYRSEETQKEARARLTDFV